MTKRENRGRLSKDRQYSGLMKETIEWSKEGDNTLARWKKYNTVANRRTDNRVAKRTGNAVAKGTDNAVGKQIKTNLTMNIT